MPEIINACQCRDEVYTCARISSQTKQSNSKCLLTLSDVGQDTGRQENAPPVTLCSVGEVLPQLNSHTSSSRRASSVFHLSVALSAAWQILKTLCLQQGFCISDPQHHYQPQRSLIILPLKSLRV